MKETLLGALFVAVILMVAGGPIGALIGGGILFWIIAGAGIWAIFALMGFAIFGFIALIGGIIFWALLMLFRWIG